jgi:hypothetical protein
MVGMVCECRSGVKWSGGEKACVEGERERERWRGKAKKEVRGKRNKG